MYRLGSGNADEAILYLIPIYLQLVWCSSFEQGPRTSQYVDDDGDDDRKRTC